MRLTCSHCTPIACCDQWDMSLPARMMQEEDHAHYVDNPITWLHAEECGSDDDGHVCRVKWVQV